MTTSEKLAELAISKLGTDFTPDWIVPDEVSCAFALTKVLNEFNPDIPIFHGTAILDQYLRGSALFEEVPQPIGVGMMQPGWIEMAATGTNSRPDIMPNGHVAMYQDNYNLMSNSSATGLWTQNYTRDTFRQRYADRGGFPLKVYRLKQ